MATASACALAVATGEIGTPEMASGEKRTLATAACVVRNLGMEERVVSANAGDRTPLVECVLSLRKGLDLAASRWRSSRVHTVDLDCSAGSDLEEADYQY